MIKLKEIEAAKNADNYEEADELEREWHTGRGMVYPFTSPETYMSYIEKLEEALRFYADPQTYGIQGGSVNRIIQDAGRQAQAALQGKES